MKPRVLVLTTYYHPVVGGVETHARQLATHLAASGFEVRVVTKRVPAAPADASVDGITVHRVGPGGERKASGKWLAVPAFFRTMLALRRHIDAIVCIDYRGIGIAAIAAGRLMSVPVIAQGETARILGSSDDGSLSGLTPESTLTRLLKSPARTVYKRADHIVCIGRDLEREALTAGVPRQRVHYLPHGVDVQRFRLPAAGERTDLRGRIGWPLDRPVVLFVGRLSIEKGVMDLLDAWRTLDRGDAILSLVGPDMTGHPWDAGASARTFVAANGLHDSVRFEGSSADPAPFYRAADVFVQPSHFEALGNTAIEAMASGLPIVASAIGGLKDFCVDGANALVHQPRSPESIARAVARLLSDAPLRGRLGLAARRTAVDRFELGMLMNRYAQLIEAAVGARTAG